MDITLKSLLQEMWADYCDLNPEAKRIYDLIKNKGEDVINDHIALRTFNHNKINIEVLSQAYLKLGYVKAQKEYIFKEKNLKAYHFEHPDSSLPKIFISEFNLEKGSDFLKSTVLNMIEQIPNELIANPRFTCSGAVWEKSYEVYKRLKEESEYAAWVYAIGFRPNHFTVSMNHLKGFSDLEDLNSFIKENGYELNSSGGQIKGTPQELLEQSSTMAKRISIEFKEGTFEIPGCYYEFAKRYQDSNGVLYQGFIAASADKIFESTNSK